MKNSKEYSSKVQKLCRSLNRKHPKVQKENHDNVEYALIYSMISEYLSELATKSAMQRLDQCFVDFNDLRVSRADEVVEMLGEDTPDTRMVSATINKVLNAIYNSYNKVSLEALKKMGKRPAKQILEKIEGVSRFAVDYCMLTSLGGHAIPLTNTMIDYLKANELVDPDADHQQIEGFLSKQISAKNGYEFYALLRAESESEQSRKKKKAAASKKKTVKAVSKTKKKTRKKKTTTKK